MTNLVRHGCAVRSPQPLHAHDRLAGTDPQRPAHVIIGWLLGRREDYRCRNQAAIAHLTRERRQVQPGIHLWPGEVGPLAVHSFHNTGRNQVRNRLPYGDPANAETYHQGSLGGDGVAWVQFALDQVLEDAANLSAFGRCRGRLAIKPEDAEITSG